VLERMFISFFYGFLLTGVPFLLRIKDLLISECRFLVLFVFDRLAGV